MKKSKLPDREELTEGSLRGHFLIAMPSLHDPHFNHSITFICDHSKDGAMGLVLNHPFSDLSLADIFLQLKLDDSHKIGNQEIFAGGPVQGDRGFVLHPPSKLWESTLAVTDDVSLTASRDILVDMAAGRGPKQSLVALGYAGWSTGQLEQEIAENAWLTLPSNGDLLFKTPAHQRWSAAADLLGIDLNLISTNAGHA